jgi:hypothetical protein
MTGMSLARFSWMFLVVAACAAPKAPQWEKPGASAAVAQQDSEQCRLDARLQAPTPRLVDRTGTATGRVITGQEQAVLSEVEFFQRCMADKGYSQKR